MKLIINSFLSIVKNNNGIHYDNFYKVAKKYLIPKNIKNNLIINLLSNKNIYFNYETNKIFYSDNKNFFIGKITKNKDKKKVVKEWLFKTYKIFFIDKNNSKIFKYDFHDLVLFKIKKGKAIIVQICKNKRNNDIGIIKKYNNKNYFLSDHTKYDLPVIIKNKNKFKNLNLSKVEVTNIKKNNDFYLADVSKIIKKTKSYNIDENSIIAKYKINSYFSKEVLNDWKHFH